jgi:hypothetical protein
VIRPIKVEALPQYRLQITYADGAQGIVDLSRDVGEGIFAPLKDEAFFRTAHIGDHGQIAWSGEIETCGDAVYREITGKKAAEKMHA